MSSRLRAEDILEVIPYRFFVTPVFPIEKLFYSGEHHEVLVRTVDSTLGDYRDADVPFVIGSLVFTGRADEATTLFRSWERGAKKPTEAEVAAGRFFLCIAECRAGRYAAAEKLCAKTLSELHGRDDPRARFYLHQGLGLVRHFTGRIASAARHASRARRHALESKFSYGRMLALDLLGHTRVQCGRVLAGLAVLEQAVELAEGIGLHDFSMTTRSAIVAYRSLFGGESSESTTSLVSHLERLGDKDRYSRRLVLTELARAHAYRGEGEAAARALERAEEVALPDGDRRAKVKLHLARALVAGLAEGEEAAAVWLRLADTLIDSELDLALVVDMAWHEYVVAPGLFARRTPSDLVRLSQKTGIARAEDLAVDRGAAPPGPPNEDRFAALVRAVRAGQGGITPLLRKGQLGLLPLAVGLTPGTRIYLDQGRRFFAVENHGNVRRSDLPTDALLELLHAIASGARTKEELIRDVWHLNVYRPKQHDPVVHTAISRLRSALEPQAAWIQATAAGYVLAAGVELVELKSTGDVETSTASEPPPAEPKIDLRRASILERVEAGETSTGEVAKLLGVSELTARRVLAALVDEGRLEKVGSGKMTRYVRRP